MTKQTPRYLIDTDFLKDLDGLEKDKSIGSGASSNTVLYIDKKTQEKYCVKIYKSEFLAKHGNNFVKKEASLLSQIKNRAVLSLYGFNLDSHYENSAIIITKYYPKNLKDSMDGPEMTQTQKYIIILGIAEGMKCIHSMNVVHRDLKPDNILLDSNNYPIICDLGLSKFIETKMTNEVGTYGYMAPEINSKYTNKVDVYSFGVVVYEILIWGSAYTQKVIGADCIENIQNSGYQLDLDRIMTSSTVIKNLLKRCLSFDPLQRPSFETIIDKLKSDDFRLAMKVDDAQVEKYLALFDDSLKNKLVDPDEIKRKALQGDLASIVKYADMLFNGDFLSAPDVPQSISFYKTAADMDDTYSMRQYALLTADMNKDEAANYMMRAVKLGCYQALLDFVEKKLGEIDMNEIENLTKFCAEKGDARAMYDYASILYQKDDKANAFKFFKDSADHNYISAISRTARMFQDGEGVGVDKAKAASYFQKGIKLKDPESMLFYAISLLNDDYSDIKMNQKEAVDAFMMSANLENVNANIFYAIILNNGYFDVKKDSKLAKQYIKNAEISNSNEPFEMAYNFAMQIADGKIKNFDKKDAALFIKIAAKKENINAMVKSDEFLPKNEALKFLHGAARKGNEIARKKYCNLKGNFYKIFYELEDKRRMFNIDILQHIISVICILFKDEFKDDMIRNLKKINVKCIKEVVNEVKDAYSYVYSSSDELDNHLIEQALSSNLKDSDFA